MPATVRVVVASCPSEDLVGLNRVYAAEEIVKELAGAGRSGGSPNAELVRARPDRFLPVQPVGSRTRVCACCGGAR